MKNTVLVLASLVCLSSAANAEDLVLCSPSATVQVVDKDLKTPLFSAQRFETVLPFQNFGQKETKSPYMVFQLYQDFFKSLNGFKNPWAAAVEKTVQYEKVEFTDREEEDADNNVGYVKKDFIKLKSKCPGYKEPVLASAQKDDDEDGSQALASTPVVATTLSINGLAPNCCLFPMKKKPTDSYTEGMRRFGARRSKGSRSHAAADLYQTQYQPVYAIAAGKVLRDRVSFYLGTNVTEIEHPGGFIARYGEIASANLKPLKLGATVKAGQLIGYIKKVNSRAVKNPMLHFELYTGKAKGPLTTGKGKFQRRSDLINPTEHLRKWEKAQFGKSY